LDREGAPPPPDRAADPLAALEAEASLPRWLAQRLLEVLGPEEVFAFAEAIDEPSAPTLRVNGARIEREELEARLREEAPGIELEPAAYAPHALRAQGG